MKDEIEVVYAQYEGLIVKLATGNQNLFVDVLGKEMSKTVIRKNESLEDALRRFKRTVSKSGTIQEVRKREFYEKPSVKRKKKSEAARKRKW